MGVATLLMAAALTQTSLTITVWPEGRDATAAPKRWTLGCDPTRGTLPTRLRACRQLAALGDAAFKPVPRDAVCTEIYGGPQDAIVTGAFGERRVWARFRRRNGCEIARWDRHAALLPVKT